MQEIMAWKAKFGGNGVNLSYINIQQSSDGGKTRARWVGGSIPTWKEQRGGGESLKRSVAEESDSETAECTYFPFQ